MSKEELKQAFIDNLKSLLMDKEAQDDEEIVDFYMEVCCDIAEEYLNQKKMMKECKCDKILKLEQELTMMFDSDVRVAMALLEEIRKLNQNKDEI